MPYLALVTVFVLTWSSAFPAAKIAIHLAPPLLFLGLRFTTAGLILLCVAWRTGGLRHTPWWTLAWLGVVNQAGYQGFAWLGMQRASAGVATIIASLSPIIVAAVAAPLLHERLGPRKVIGLALGLAGAVLVVRNRIAIGEDRTGIILLFGSLAAITIGTLAFKRMAPSSSLAATVGMQQVAAGMVLGGAGLASENPALIPWANPDFWLMMVWFVAVISIGSLLLWFALLRRQTASAASALHFLMPPVGLVMSWAALGEPLHAMDLLGVAPIAAGIWLVTRPDPIAPAAAPARR